MEKAIIVAASTNDVIGVRRDGKPRLPWRLRADIDHFRDLTTYHTIVSGRVTYESIPKEFRPLKNRLNIVISSTMKSEKGMYVVPSVEDAISLAEREGFGCTIWGIGGSRIYDAMLPLADRIELTRVQKHIEGDTYLPTINWAKWNLVDERPSFNKSEGIHYSFQKYTRRKGI